MPDSDAESTVAVEHTGDWEPNVRVKLTPVSDGTLQWRAHATGPYIPHPRWGFEKWHRDALWDLSDRADERFDTVEYEKGAVVGLAKVWRDGEILEEVWADG
ncbi:hypothetical protein [Halolamina salifodinae]|uniref:Uncharacterized protein n=1 Tax=Halolamina salifodinae TaxID=1202767 RepID=A0A8T4GVS0_9EURY|nr:hypothetical protein [Halolamina salifodinae]MBP1987211.1 hypothetical protein [Halolamina salifodinae]